MRLLRLTTRQPTADFEAVYNSDIVLKPNSKIALQSVSIDSDPIGINVESSNNQINYEINDSYAKNVQLTKRSYTTTNIDELLTDITDKLNDSVIFDVNDPGSNSPKALGLQWKASKEDTNRVTIEYDRGIPDNYKDNWSLKDTVFTARSATNNQYNLSMSDNDSTENFDKNCILPIPLAKGNGYFRCRTRLLNQGSNVKQGYIMGLYNDGDMTNDNIDFAKIVYGVRVNINTGTGQRFYKPIINGVEGATTNMNSYTNNSPRANPNEFQEVTINGNQVNINIYRANSSVPTTLNSSPLIYNQEDLRPVVVFFGNKATTVIDNVRMTPDPFFEPANPIVLNVTGDYGEDITAPVRPTGASVSVDDANVLIFNSAVLANFLGYDFQRIPLIGTRDSGNGGNTCVYEAARQFTVVQEADAMLVQLMNLQVESYDSYSDIITYGNGQRTNILAVIPSKDEAGKVVYEPNERFFLDLDNREPIYLRNLHIRVLREDYSDININGLATVVVLIE